MLVVEEGNALQKAETAGSLHCVGYVSRVVAAVALMLWFSCLVYKLHYSSGPLSLVFHCLLCVAFFSFLLVFLSSVWLVLLCSRSGLLRNTSFAVR